MLITAFFVLQKRLLLESERSPSARAVFFGIYARCGYVKIPGSISLMDLNLMGDDGGASVDTPAAQESETIASEGVENAQPIISDSGDESPADLTIQNTDEESANPDDEESALLAAANDPNTPQWARQKIQEAMSYAGKLKEARLAAEERANALASQYEGKDVLPPEEIERMRAAEDKLFNLSSIATTPDDLDKAIRELNPRVYNDYRNQLVWSALEKDDGSPDIDNLQFIVDKFAGGPGVKADDVLAAMNALKSGFITAEDFHQFASTEEYEAFQRTQEREKQIEERQRAIDENARYQETQIRQGELGTAIANIQSQLDSQIAPLLDRFKLTPVENEPKAASDYKARVNERIKQVVDAAPKQIKELAEIARAVDILKQPGSKAVDAQTAVNEVRQFINSPAFQQNVNRGLSSLMTQIEQVVSQEAYYYKLMMQGLEVENSKGQKARPVIGAPSQTANLPKLTEDDLAKMSAKERAQHAARTASEAFRQLNPAYGQASRTGQ